MARGFQYRVHRCYICHHEAVSTDRDGRPLCAVHLDKNYEDRAFEESTKIIELVGREEYYRLLDIRFPGDDATVTFPSKDYYEWAKETRERLEREKCPSP